MPSSGQVYLPPARVQVAPPAAEGAPRELHAAYRRPDRRDDASARAVRVVAAVRNGVDSDLRVLKTAHLIQSAGFESCAIGWSSSAETAHERHVSGVEIRRAQAGGTAKQALLLCRAAWKTGRSLREIVEDEGVGWVQRELGRLPRSPELPPSIPGRPSPARPLPVALPAAPSQRASLAGSLRKQVHSVARHLHSEGRKALQAVVPGLADKLQARLMMLYLAETFWDIYPLLLTSGADLIHAHELTVLLPAVVAARKLGVPVIYDSHELEFARNSPWGAETFAFWKAHERDLIRLVDGVIAVSEGCAEALRAEYDLPPELLTVVRNCPSGQQRDPARGLREVVGLPQEAPLLVFVGKITQNRGLELLLHVLGRLPGFFLACVGPEETSYREGLEQTAREAGVRDRMFFLPPVAGDAVVPFIAEADVSVMPIQDACLSYRYCLPNKLFESAHAGVPIVTSALPDMQAYVARYGIGLAVQGEDPERWARAIESTYQQRDLYYTPEKIARIRRESSAEHEVAGVCALYQRVLTDSVVLPA